MYLGLTTYTKFVFFINLFIGDIKSKCLHGTLKLQLYSWSVNRPKKEAY